MSSLITWIATKYSTRAGGKYEAQTPGHFGMLSGTDDHVALICVLCRPNTDVTALCHLQMWSGPPKDRTGYTPWLSIRSMPVPMI
jgi:hypothetical protein